MADARVQVLINAVDNASRQFQTIGQTLDQFAEKTRRVGRQLALAGGAVTGFAALTIKASSDLNESINAVQVLFGEGSKAILEFGKTSAQMVGLSSASFNQLASTTGAMLLNFGVPMERASGLTIELTQRAADLASVFNTDVNDAMAAIQSGLQGMALPLRRYAIDVTEATLETTALAMGIQKSVSEMTQSEKAQIRLAAIFGQSNAVAGDFVRTSDSFANSMRVLKADAINAAAAIGDSLRPAVERGLSVIRPMLAVITEWAKTNPQLIMSIAAVGVATVGLGTGLLAIGLILPAIVSGIAVLIGILKGLGTAFLLLRAIAVSSWLAILGPIALIIAALLVLQKELLDVQKQFRLVPPDAKSELEKLGGLAAEVVSTLTGAMDGMLGMGEGAQEALKGLDKIVEDVDKTLEDVDKIINDLPTGISGLGTAVHELGGEFEFVNRSALALEEQLKEILELDRIETLRRTEIERLERGGIFGLGAQIEDFLQSTLSAQILQTVRDLTEGGLGVIAAWDVAMREASSTVMGSMNEWAAEVEHGQAVLEAFNAGTISIEEAYTTLKAAFEGLEKVVEETTDLKAAFEGLEKVVEETTEAIEGQLVFQMHSLADSLRAAIGEVGGPIRGLVESFARREGLTEPLADMLAGRAVSTEDLLTIQGLIEEARRWFAEAQQSAEFGMRSIASSFNAWIAARAQEREFPGIPTMQHGGIVTRPTMAMIGEAGPEAVIPLADMLAGRAVLTEDLLTIQGLIEEARRWFNIAGQQSAGFAAVITARAQEREFPGIPMMQHGGIVTRPTMAMIGEAGPEAVIPLGNRGGQSQPIIVLQIDGRTIATVLGNQAVLEEQVRSS